MLPADLGEFRRGLAAGVRAPDADFRVTERQEGLLDSKTPQSAAFRKVSHQMESGWRDEEALELLHSGATMGNSVVNRLKNKTP